MKLLITGSTGLLGSRLIELLGKDAEVFTVGTSTHENSNVSFPVNFSNDWTVKNFPPKNDVIIHLAQSQHFRNFPEKALDIFNTNVASTAKLLDYAYKSGTKRFIYASTGGIYRPGSNVLTEDAELLTANELTYYFASKLTSEMLVSTYRKFFDVHVMRIFFMYGVNQKSDMFLPNLINRIKLGEAIMLNGNNGISLNPVHVDDVAQAIINITKNGGPKTINASGPEIMSIKDIANLVAQILNTEPNFNITKEENLDLVADSKIFQDILHRELIPVTKGIVDLLNKKN
jgi:UDP-glucose 4-epimerase